MQKSEKEKMLAGELYMANDPVLTQDRLRARALTRQFNASREDEGELRAQLISELFGSIGTDVSIEPTFRCDYGYNISVGDRFYANFDCVFLDVNTITIGNDVLLAPRVQLYTAGHPIDPEVRKTGLEYAKPIVIEDGVWIGGGVIVNPGVTIGKGSIIGAGSVVTKDIPAGVIAVGNPCRVIRSIPEGSVEPVR